MRINVTSRSEKKGNYSEVETFNPTPEQPEDNYWSDTEEINWETYEQNINTTNDKNEKAIKAKKRIKYIGATVGAIVVMFLIFFIFSMSNLLHSINNIQESYNQESYEEVEDPEYNFIEGFTFGSEEFGYLTSNIYYEESDSFENYLRFRSVDDHSIGDYIAGAVVFNNYSWDIRSDKENFESLEKMYKDNNYTYIDEFRTNSGVYCMLFKDERYEEDCKYILLTEDSTVITYSNFYISERDEDYVVELFKTYSKTLDEQEQHE